MIFSDSLQSAQPLACQLFEASIAQNHLGHAYLLVGSDRHAKRQFAIQLTSFLNCQDAARAQAGSCLVRSPASRCLCQNCQWIGDLNHPQALLELAGSGASQKIPVEKARLLSDELSKTSVYFRVILIADAAEIVFHRSSANALLKSIEEPPDRCLFLLFADAAADVLPTIASRTQVVPFLKTQQPGIELDEFSLGKDACLFLRNMLSEFIKESKQFSYRAPVLEPDWRRSALALELAKRLSNQAEELETSGQDKSAASMVLDVFFAAELAVWQTAACSNASVAAYLLQVAGAIEDGKSGLSQFVKPSHVFECFSFALMELRLRYAGELYLAKE